MSNSNKSGGDAKKQREDATIRRALRILEGRMQTGPVMSSPSAFYDYCRLRIAPMEREVFMVAYLDTRHRLITAEELFLGTIDRSEVHPREVVKRALEVNASAVLFAHNHPSHVSEPSSADRHITELLCQALKLVDIRVLDHVVVGLADYVSFAQRGWL